MRFFGDSISSRTSGARSLVVAVCLVMAGITGLTGLVGTAEAKLVKEKSSSTESGPDAVFAAIAEAWKTGDEEILAGLVHQDGLRVTNGEYERFTNYSPNQAFYFFKNQFQTHATVAFTIERLQDSNGALDRVHGMVVWSYRKANLAAIQEKKLVLVLTRLGDVWRLAEINTITMK